MDRTAALLAIRWCEYLETHARRLYASEEDASKESAQALLTRIKKGDLLNGFSPRDVYHGRHWSKLDSVEKVNNAIKVLEDLGWVRSESVKTPGRPAIKIYVHPLIRRNK